MDKEITVEEIDALTDSVAWQIAKDQGMNNPDAARHQARVSVMNQLWVKGQMASYRRPPQASFCHRGLWYRALVPVIGSDQWSAQIMDLTGWILIETEGGATNRPEALHLAKVLIDRALEAVLDGT